MPVFNVIPAASPGLHPPQYDPQDLGIFESARMDREMAREMGQNSQRRNKKSVIGTALANMSTPRLLILVSGVLLLVGGLLALRSPVFLTDFDQWGFQINCGRGFGSDWTQAATADSAGTPFVQQCHAAIAMRRAWAVPRGGGRGVVAERTAAHADARAFAKHGNGTRHPSGAVVMVVVFSHAARIFVIDRVPT